MNTSISCRHNAVIDQARAEAEPLASRRDVWLASASAWRQRADTLDRIGRESKARYPTHREAIEK